MKKTLYVLIGFAFCVTVPALAETYRANGPHPMSHGPRQVLLSAVQR